MNNIFVHLFSLLSLMIWTVSAQAAELKIIDIVMGTGEEAVKEKIVEVHYSGWLMNGKKFDSSLDRKQPFSFTLGAREVIPGWDEGVLGMKVGGKRELIIPPKMAYGARGAGGVIPGNATLRFEVELLSVAGLAYQNIDNTELKSLLKQGVTLVDIRTEGEWKKTGIIEGSKLLPYRMVNGKINPKFAEDMARIIKPTGKVILICHSGNRSRSASDLLSSRFGFTGIYNARRGITSWIAEKNQTVKANLEDVKNTCSVC